jgi:hypothetical protein
MLEGCTIEAEKGYEVASTRSCITPSLSKGIRDASQAGIRAYPHPKVWGGIPQRDCAGFSPDFPRISATR